MNISLIIFVGAVLYMSEKKVDRKMLMALAAGGGLLFLMSRNQDTFDDDVCGSGSGTGFFDFNYCSTVRPSICGSGSGSGSGDGCSGIMDMDPWNLESVKYYLSAIVAGILGVLFGNGAYEAHKEEKPIVRFFCCLGGFVCAVWISFMIYVVDMKISNYKPASVVQPTITYDPITATVGGDSISVTPTISPTEALVDWTWTSTLPAGLDVNTSTGVITGSPTPAATAAAATPTPYTITATPPSTDSTDRSAIQGTVNITVVGTTN